jgi:glycosyltransferase involved in cell wall biosynthesis
MGDGISEIEMRSMIATRGLEERVQWAGRRASWNEVRQAYLSHDALLFTSLRDSFGSQILEAMGVGLPVIALDQSGAHDFIPEEAGIKVPIASNAEEMSQALSSAMNRFATLAIADRNAMSIAAWQASKTFDWSKRAGAAVSHYRRILHQTPNTHKAAKANSFQESV